MLNQMAATDAEDGYKSMRLKSSYDKVTEADPRHMLSYFDFVYLTFNSVLVYN